jgi:hypothetical protein
MFSTSFSNPWNLQTFNLLLRLIKSKVSQHISCTLFILYFVIITQHFRSWLQMFELFGCQFPLPILKMFEKHLSGLVMSVTKPKLWDLFG